MVEHLNYFPPLSEDICRGGYINVIEQPVKTQTEKLVKPYFDNGWDEFMHDLMSFFFEQSPIFYKFVKVKVECSGETVDGTFQSYERYFDFINAAEMNYIVGSVITIPGLGWGRWKIMGGQEPGHRWLNAAYLRFPIPSSWEWVGSTDF